MAVGAKEDRPGGRVNGCCAAENARLSRWRETERAGLTAFLKRFILITDFDGVRRRKGAEIWDS